MKKEQIQIIINGKTVPCFEPVCVEIRWDENKTWYSVQGYGLDKPKKKARRK